MALIKQSLAAILCLGMLIACGPKKEGADTHAWEVTAQNGDKMVGCLAEDVTPDLLGYIDIEALPNFDVKTFENFESGANEYLKSGKIQTHLVDMSNAGSHPAGLRWKREDKIRHCEAYPPPEGTKEWYLSKRTGDLAVRYRLFSVGEKMVFIDARTRIAKINKP